jgi:hypothetical protein
MDARNLAHSRDLGRYRGTSVEVQHPTWNAGTANPQARERSAFEKVHRLSTEEGRLAFKT